MVLSMGEQMDLREMVEYYNLNDNFRFGMPPPEVPRSPINQV